MVMMMDPAYYSARVKNDTKLPAGVTGEKEYSVIGYVSSEQDGRQFISHWIVVGDNGGPVYLWPQSIVLLPNLPSSLIPASSLEETPAPESAPSA